MGNFPLSFSLDDYLNCILDKMFDIWIKFEKNRIFYLMGCPAPHEECKHCALQTCITKKINLMRYKTYPKVAYGTVASWFHESQRKFITKSKMYIN